MPEPLRNNVQWSWPTAPVSTPTYGGNQNRPPTERVWEEEREDERPVTVDYTTSVDTSQPADTSSPIVTTNQIINEKLPGTLPVIENLGSSNLEKLLTDEERKLNMLYALQNQWETTTPGKYPISSPFGLTGHEFDPESSEWYSTDSTNPYGLAYHGATQYDNQGNIIGGTQMGDPGAVLLNAKAVSFGHPPVYGKPVLSGIGEELYNYDWTDGGDNPYGTIPNPEEIYMYADEEGNMKPSPILEKMEGISRDYYDQAWDPWTDPWYGGHKQSVGPAGMTLAELARHTWFSESLADVERREQERLEEGLDVATMSDMEDIFGEEFGGGANPLFDPEFSESATAEMNPLYADITLFEQARS